MKINELISEKELKEIVLNEYRRKYEKKYGMTFFEKENIVEKRNFSWDVEKDAMQWEHAIESLKVLSDKIKKIEELNE
ncbi:hypothetical protein V4D30_08580 [Thermodesulfovibrio sp. 3907-1M]|uniref:Uncharacterized protein n=1 Tax=Thermodesulfovibrio autotrophicus TaxID=3118333 RepID=A0AAU8GVA7_9BACT